MTDLLKKLFALIVLTSVFFLTCKSDNLTDSSSNNTPEINEISISPLLPIVEEWIIFTAVAFDKDGDNLSYLWSCPTGEFFPGDTTNNPARWKVTASGVHNITCAVSDGKDITRKSISIDVLSERRIISYSSMRNNNFDIHIMDEDGSNQHQLTNHSADDYWGTWSPDGERIAFSSNRDGDFEIHIMNSDGSNRQQITNNIFSDLEPNWSPDGRFLGFDEVLYMEGRGQFAYFDFETQSYMAWDDVIGSYSWSVTASIPSTSI